MLLYSCIDCPLVCIAAVGDGTGVPKYYGKMARSGRAVTLWQNGTGQNGTARSRWHAANGTAELARHGPGGTGVDGTAVDSPDQMARR